MPRAGRRLDAAAGRSFLLVLDAAGAPGGIVVAAPTHYTFRAIFKGKAAHAGVEPEKGVSAGHVILVGGIGGGEVVVGPRRSDERPPEPMLLPVDGAHEVLARVRARGVPTVLCSNWDHARAGSAMLAQTRLAPLLDHVVISEAVGFRKPHPKIFEEALAPFGAEPRAALHVGDMAEADAWGAGRLGFRTVWIDREEQGWPDEFVPAPSLTVAHLDDLLEHF